MTAAILAAALVLGAGVYVPVALLTPLEPTAPVVTAVTPDEPPAADLMFAGYGATAVGAVGFDGVLASSGIETPLPIASISKVVTALVVLDAHPLAAGESGPDVTMTPADVALYDQYLGVGGKVEPVRAGFVFSQRDLLELTLVSSANNYADALAIWAFGSREAFVTAAADWLQRSGFAQTTIVEPTGLSPLNVSTATELVRLGTMALANPTVAETVAMPTAPVANIGEIENSNELLGIDGIDGIKTGTLDAAGACLLFAADYTVPRDTGVADADAGTDSVGSDPASSDSADAGADTVTVVGVMLGGADHDSLNVDVQRLLDGVADGFQRVQLADRGEAFATYRTEWNDSASAVAAADASTLVWSDPEIAVDVTVESLGEAREGAPVGTATFVVDGEVISIDLVLDEALGDPGAWWRIGDFARFLEE